MEQEQPRRETWRARVNAAIREKNYGGLTNSAGYADFARAVSGGPKDPKFHRQHHGPKCEHYPGVKVGGRVINISRYSLGEVLQNQVMEPTWQMLAAFNELLGLHPTDLEKLGLVATDQNIVAWTLPRPRSDSRKSA